MKRPEDTVDAQRVTYLWLAQRLSAMVLALCIIVHLVTIVGAVQGGLSAAEIIDRVAGSGVWFAFYAVFVAAVVVHASRHADSLPRFDASRYEGNMPPLQALPCECVS